MKKRSLIGLSVFGLMVLLIFLLFNPLSSSSQDVEKEKKVIDKSVAASVPDEDLESKNPGKKPYVAPQPYIATPDETKDLETIVEDSETEVIYYDSEESFRAMDGFAFGSDNLVSNFTTDYTGKINPDTAVDISGTIYVAMEAYHIPSSKTRIVTMRSSDYGKTWSLYSTLSNSSYNLKTPSIAVGEGSTNGRRLLVAFIVDASPPKIEVWSKNLDSISSTIQTLPHYDSPYAKPIIKTDSPYFSGWYAFIVAEWQIDAVNNNINIEYWRSTDGGLTWLDDATNRKTIYGNTDSYEWRCPDLVQKYPTNYITVYRKDTRTIYITKDFGTNTWAITTLPYEPGGEVYPRIAGVYGTSNLMIVFLNKVTSTGYDQAYYIYSLNNGSIWQGDYVFPGWYSDAHLPVVAAPSNAFGYFHAVYTSSWDVYHCRRPVDLSTTFSSRKRVSDRNYASHTYPQKGIAAFHDNAHAFMVWNDFYGCNNEIYGDRTYPDDFLGTWTGQGVYFRTERDTWIKMATPATLLTTGDLDGDGTDDPIGIWPGQGGVWVKYSSTGTWAYLSTTADWIATGDMSGDGRDDLLGTWSGQGVYYRDSASGSWVKLATPATKITAGNLDGSCTGDDLIGIWPGQGGVWVKYSSSGDWELLSSTAQDIAVGDMNGNYNLLGTWSGQGVYYRDSVSGSWVKLATPATLITAGDLDSDGSDDLIGIWPGQGGVWVKYSKTDTWAYISSTADSITAGMMRGGSGSWITGAGYELVEPVGGEYINEPLGIPGEDFLGFGPGAKDFMPLTEEMNLVPSGKEALKPGPGRPGFIFKTTPNLIPREKELKQKK